MFELHNAKKYPALGIQKHLCWPVGYSGTGGWGATPEPKQYFLALCSSNTIIRGTQKHLCWPVGCSGMGGWGATPEHKQFFGIVQFKHHHPRYSKKTSASLQGTEVWVFGAPPQNPNNSSCHCAFQTPPSEVSKNTFPGL